MKLIKIIRVVGLALVFTSSFVKAEPNDYIRTPIVEYGEREIDYKFGKQKNRDGSSDFAHSLGYGGKLDLSADNVVVDFKTKETPLESVVPYHEHILQLSAYREGLNMPTARCAIVFVNGSSNEVKLCEITEQDLQDGWECFKHLLRDRKSTRLNSSH